MPDDLGSLPSLVRHSRRTPRLLRQNIVFALGLEVALLALAPAGSATL